MDVLDLEALGQGVQGEDLFLGPGRPSQEGEEVDHRLGQVALSPIAADGGLALPLAHLGAVRIEDQRDVGEDRHLVTQRPEEEHVQRRVGDMVLAADHVRDAHGGVIHDHHEVVEGAAV